MCIELQGTLTAKNERVQDLEDELELVKSELVTLMESSSRSESTNMYMNGTRYYKQIWTQVTLSTNMYMYITINRYGHRLLY